MAILVPLGNSWVGIPLSRTDDINRLITSRLQSLASWQIGLALEENFSIREKMTLFWYNHFVTADIRDANFRYHNITSYRQNFLGNFRELTKMTTIDPAMLRYLNVYAQILQDVAEKGSNESTHYPETGTNRLVDQLRIVAQLISGGLKTKIYVVNMSGFDTHANQVGQTDAMTGNHARLLSELSEAVFAFVDDLRMQGVENRVIGATRSEFGRQIASNGSFGTDHGDAAPLIVFGSCVNAGIVGENPKIPENPEPQSGVPVQIDFKNIFGSILMDWFGASEAEIQQLFSHNFEHMPIVNACNVTTSSKAFSDHQIYQFRTYPNPFIERINSEFNSPGKRIRLSLTNSIGHEVYLLEDKFFPSGAYKLSHQIPELTPGQYFSQIKSDQFQQVIPVVHF